jgi:hypothetical protein
MTDTDIYAKIEEIYNSEKGKNFITHLIRSFIPVHRSAFMIDNERKKVLVCAITGTPLVTKSEIVQFQVNNVKDVTKNMVDRALGKTTSNVVLDAFEGKLLAVECEKSDKLLCQPAHMQLQNFCATELMKGNKHIRYLIADERNKEERSNRPANNPSNNPSNSHSDKLPNGESQSRVSAHGVVHSNKKAAFSLGDLDALKELKQKLENN